MKLTKRKEKEFRADWGEFNKLLKQSHSEKISFEQYVERRMSKVKSTAPSTCEIPSYQHPRQTTEYPSLNTMTGTTAKREPHKYSGKRKLLGVATMHKSNMVPIFSEEEAEDVAKMRRN